jgi:hypothetical protein
VAILGVLVAALATGVGVTAATLVLASGWDTLPSADGRAEASIGASSDGYAVWARNQDGTPVRWDPCRPVPLVVNHDGAPAGAQQDLDEAVRRLREATGLDLVVVAATDERPAAERPPYQPDRYGERWAPVLVAWARPHERGLPLRDSDRGVAIPVAVGSPGERTYVTGQVVLNVDRADLEAGFGDRSYSWGSTIVHELAHVLGLAHVDDADQLLHVHPGEGPVSFGAGDLAGLDAVGAAGGCVEVPRAQHVEVRTP